MCPAQPPFNTQARAEAGFGEQWYLPLAAVDKQQPEGAVQPPAKEAISGAHLQSDNDVAAAGARFVPITAACL